MASKRLARVNELLKREIGDSMYRILSEADVDLAQITFTRVETSSNLRHAKVYVSVRDHDLSAKKVLHQLYQHRKAFQDAIAKDITLKYVPRLSFVDDHSIAEGDRILQLMEEIEIPADEQEEED